MKQVRRVRRIGKERWAVQNECRGLTEDADQPLRWDIGRGSEPFDELDLEVNIGNGREYRLVSVRSF